MCGAEFDTAELRTVGDARVCAPCDDKFGDALWELVKFAGLAAWALFVFFVELPRGVEIAIALLAGGLAAFGLLGSVRRRRAVDAVEAGAALALSLLQLFAPPG